MVRGVGTALALLFWFVTAYAADDYLTSYQKGAYLVESNDCANGKPLIQEAMKVAPRGNAQKSYFPTYYLAICSLQENDLDSAEKYLKQAEAAGIYFSGMAKDFKTLKDQLKAKQKEPHKQKIALIVVVNPANPITDISMSDLGKIYKGEKQTWADNSRIVPVLDPANSAENQEFLSIVCQMDEKKLLDLWQGQQFNGTKLPVVVANKEWILRYIYGNAGAIAFYTQIPPNPQVKIITVDGKDSIVPP